MSELSHDALELLINTSVASGGVDKQFVIGTLPGGREYVIATRNGNNVTTEIRPISEPPRDHKLLSVDDVVSWAKNYCDENNGVVYVGKDRIVVTMDEADDRVLGHKATYAFEKTPLFVLLETLSTRDTPYQQAVLIKLLRTTLRDSFKDNQQRLDLIKALRNVTAAQNSQLASGSVSAKATYIAGETVNGVAVEWPDSFILSVRVFDDDSLPTTEDVEIVFDVDANSRTFTLLPTVSSLTKAANSQRNLATEMIREKTKDDDSIKVFLGSP